MTTTCTALPLFRVCLVEGEAQDAAAVRAALEGAELTRFETDWISTPDEGIAAMVANGYDAYLLGTSVGSRDGIDVLRDARSQGCNRPIIVLTEIKLRELDATAMSAGATDFLNKDDLSAPLLERSIRFASERIRADIACLELEASKPRRVLIDPLTGVGSRALLMDRLEQALRRARRTQDYRFAVLYLDLDEFAGVNAQHGHELGDQVLVTVAERLAKQLREIDTIARLDGDEFCILLDGTADAEGVEVVRKRISAVIAEPIACQGHEIAVTCSIGVVLSPRAYRRPLQVLGDADAAMAQARAAR